MKVNEIVAVANKVQGEMEEHLDDVDALSADILKLGVYKSKLGDYLVKLNDEVRNQETHIKYLKATRMSELVKGNKEVKGVAVNRAELQVTEELLDEQMQLNQKTKAQDLIKIKRSDMGDLIDAGRSRLAFIREETT